MNRIPEISKVRIVKNLHNSMENMVAIMIGPVQASRLDVLARGLVFLACGLIVAEPAISADTRVSSALYRKAVNDANASYQAHLLQCNTTNRGERTLCRREARAARTEALAAAKTQRTFGTDKSVDPSKPPNPEMPSGLKASKTDIAPQLQRDSPPDIILPKKNNLPLNSLRSPPSGVRSGAKLT
ncbi:MAG: hypothetical protein ACTS8S_10390 [Giesbergeria sp.]